MLGDRRTEYSEADPKWKHHASPDDGFTVEDIR